MRNNEFRLTIGDKVVVSGEVDLLPDGSKWSAEIHLGSGVTITECHEKRSVAVLRVCLAAESESGEPK